MKYIIKVNAKYLVSIEAETQLAAEHAVLEYDGIWGALAFDSDAMKTETFRSACLMCETVSLSELIAMSNDYHKAWADYASCVDTLKAAGEEVNRLEELLKAAKEKQSKALQAVYQQKQACADANDSLHVPEN